MEQTQTTEQRRAEYDQWLEDVYRPKWGGDVSYAPPPFDHWVEGHREPYGRVTREFVGRDGVELGYTIATWKACDPPHYEEARAGATMLLKGAVQTLWLHSPGPGTTKTGLAIATAREFADSGIGPATILRMHRVGALELKEHGALLNTLKTFGLAILDDAHRFRFGTAVQSDFFHSICDILYAHKIKTIVTANASFAALSQNAGKDLEAAFDRLRNGGLHEVDMTGDSRRG